MAGDRLTRPGIDLGLPIVELVQFEELSGPLPKADVPPPSTEVFLNFGDQGTPT